MGIFSSNHLQERRSFFRQALRAPAPEWADSGPEKTERQAGLMSVLSEAIGQIDTSRGQSDAVAETLDLLVEVAQAKAELFSKLVEENLTMGRVMGKSSSTDSLYFPITFIKDKRVEYRCVGENKPADLIEKVGESISGMMEDHSGGGDCLRRGENHHQRAGASFGAVRGPGAVLCHHLHLCGGRGSEYRPAGLCDLGPLHCYAVHQAAD